MARSSLYSYFTSREDLFDALVADTFPRWSSYVLDRMARQRTPGAKVLAYVDANLHLVARGDHALVFALAPSRTRCSSPTCSQALRRRPTSE